MYVKKVNKLIRKKINGYEDIDFKYLEAVRFKKSTVESTIPRLNLVLPQLKKQFIFGGVSTALKIFNHVVQKFGLSARIIITDVSIDDELKKQYPEYHFLSASDDIDIENETMVCSVDPLWRTDNHLSIRENDIFLTTMWITEFVIDNVVSFQKEVFGHSNNIMYLIQDYEPIFYKGSSEYLLAESTYKSDHVFAVFNSSSLKQYFHQLDYQFVSESVFDPRLNDRMLKILQKYKEKPINRENIILFYGRPNAFRNCFSLGVESLKLLIKKYKIDSSWKFISVGSNYKDIQLGNGFVLKSLGKLTLDEYAGLLLKSKVGLSLMCSPHPSYPPLEMSTFGIQTITNDFSCKEMSTFNHNIISLKQVNFDTIADALKAGIDKSESPTPIDFESDYVSDSNQFQDVEKMFASQYLIND